MGLEFRRVDKEEQLSNEWGKVVFFFGGGVKKALRAECLSIECFMANKRIEGKGIVFNSLLEKGPLAWLKGEGILGVKFSYELLNKWKTSKQFL